MFRFFSLRGSHKEKKGFRKEEPFIIKYLENYIEKWYSRGEVLIIEPRKACFDTLSIFRRSIGLVSLGEWEWQLVAEKKIVSPEEMDKVNQELYRKIKPWECRLCCKGLLRKTYSFAPMKTSKSMRSFKSEKLAKILNSNERLMSLVHKIRADSGFIVLYSGVEPSKILDSERSSTNEIMKTMADFHLKPPEITWMISLNRGFLDQSLSRKTVLNMYDALNLISKLAEEATRLEMALFRSVLSTPS